MILKVEYPPTANHMKVPVAFQDKITKKWRARMILAPKGRDYYQRVDVALRGVKPLKPPYEVLVEVHVPDLRKRDLCNVEKASIDALDKAGVIEDDSQIDDIQIVRFPPMRSKGILVVRIREVEAGVRFSRKSILDGADTSERAVESPSASVTVAV
jgi:crossover junction endodeoxyribonuclease RusA